MADLNDPSVPYRPASSAAADQHVTASIARVNWDLFHPRPLASSPRHRRRFANRYVGNPARITGRELRQDEVDAIVDHFSRGTRDEYVYSLPASLACTYYFWNKGASTYRFPFLGPRPVPRFLAALASPGVAHWAWQVARWMCYDFLCKYTVGETVGSLAFRYGSRGSLTDPRLAELREDNARRVGQLHDELMQRVGRKRPDPVSPYMSGTQRPQALPDHADGYTETTEENTQPDGWRVAENQSADQTNPGQPRSTRPTWPRPSYTPTPPSQQPHGSFDDNGASLFDDASPVSPDWRDELPSQPSSARPGQSAWDRLRRQAQSKDQTPAQSSWEARRQKPGSQSQSQTDQDWTYKSDENLQAETEREKAQKEFDAMLERERRTEQNGRRR